MNPITAHPPISAGTLSFDQLALGLGHPLRWRLLAELSAGEPRMVVELARHFRLPPTTVSKHLAAMRRAGVVTVTRRLYTIPAYFRPVPGERIVDFGRCVLRLGEPV